MVRVHSGVPPLNNLQPARAKVRQNPSIHRRTGVPEQAPAEGFNRGSPAVQIRVGVVHSNIGMPHPIG